MNEVAKIRKLLTLVLVHQNDKILLGRKKRGFGGFGGGMSGGGASGRW